MVSFSHKSKHYEMLGVLLVVPQIEFPGLLHLGSPLLEPAYACGSSHIPRAWLIYHQQGKKCMIDCFFTMPPT